MRGRLRRRPARRYIKDVRVMIGSGAAGSGIGPLFTTPSRSKTNMLAANYLAYSREPETHLAAAIAAHRRRCLRGGL